MSHIHSRVRLVALTLVAILVGVSSTFGQGTSPERGNRLSVTVSTRVTQNASGVYTYSYTVTNAATSAQSAWFVAVDFGTSAPPPLQNVTSPAGWEPILTGFRSRVAWAAVGGDEVPGAADDGNVTPSPFEIFPGQSLIGFSFQSSRPPVNVRVFVQGFTPIPATDGDADEVLSQITNPLQFTDNSVAALAQGPRGYTAADIQPPSVAGFLAILSPTDRNTLIEPATVRLRFGAFPLQVDRLTFAASLNGRDVTSLFQTNNPVTDLTATLSSTTAPLVMGRNTLSAHVSGINPNTGEVAVDFDEVTFFVNTDPPADPNGDGATDCADLAIIRAAYGTRTHQPRFDPRADLNGDGMINIVDLSTAARAVPTNATCR